MRKILSFLTAILFAGSMMADSYTITFKDGGTDSDKTSSLTSTTVSDYVDAGAEYVSAIAPTGKVYLAKTGAGLKFGNSSGGGSVTLTLATPIKPTSIVISASQFGASEGSGLFQEETFDMTGGGGKYAFNDYTVTYDGETEVATISVGTAKRGYVNSITVNYASQGGGEPVAVETKTIYCSPFSEWHNDGARFAVYALGDGENTAWYDLVAVEGAENVYSAEIAEAFPTVIFCRMNGATTENNWDNKWNQTADLTLPTDGKNLYTITGWNENDGIWSVYGEEPVVVEPTLPVVAIAGTMNEWSATASVMANAEDNLSASVKIALEAQTYEFKVVSDGKWLSLNGEGESLYRFHREWNEVAHINGIDVRNFELAADVAGEYTFTWTYADSTLRVTFPEKPVEPAAAVVLPATLDVTNVSFRSEGMPDFVIAEGEDYAGTYFDMGAHDSSNDTLLYAEWNVTIQPIKYNVAVDVYNTNSWSVRLYLLNQTGDTVKALYYKGHSGEKGQFAIGSLDLSDLEAGNYKVRAHAATAWSAMKLKDVIFTADYQGVNVDLPGTLLPAYAELSAGASIANNAIAFAPSTANNEYATWNVSFAEAGSYNVTIDMTATNGHTYGVALLSADGAEQIAAVAEAQAWDTGVKELGAIAVPAAGNYKVKLTNATQWSEAVLNSITFAAAPAAPEYYLAGTMNEWAEAADGYKFEANPESEGEYMLTTTLAEGAEFKVRCGGVWYPAEGGNYVVDAAHAGEKTIYFRPDGQGGEGWHYGAIYVAANEEPVVEPVTSDIWKVVAETSNAAEAIHVDNNLIKIAGVYATTVGGASYTYGEEAFTHTIQVRNNAYPTADNKNGTEQSGSSPLIVTAKENIDVTLYYVRQTGNEAENDSKDLIVFDQEDLSRLTGTFAMTPSANEGYFLTTKKLSLVKDHVYTLSAKGTTIKLSGIAYGVPAPVVEDPAKFYITGDSALVVDAGLDVEMQWNPAAIKSQKDTFVLSNLKADQYYLLKVTLDGTWNEGMVKGFNDLTEEIAGLDDVDGENHNIGFKLTEDGEVKVVYFVEDEVLTFKLIGNFYVDQTPVIEPEVHTYTVAGDNTTLFGMSWTPALEVNDMALVDGIYKWEKSEVALAEGSVQFKVVKDHDWNYGSYPADNYQLAIPADGIYTVTITFDPANLTVDATALKTGNAEVEKHYLVAGQGMVANGEDWNNDADINLMTSSDEGLTYTLTIADLQLVAGTEYRYKIVEKGSWIEYFPKHVDNSDTCFTVPEDGIYTITYVYTVATSLCEVQAQRTGDLPAARLTDGYYLVGNFSGVPAWSVDGLTDAQRFVEVETDEFGTSYSLAADLAVDDSIKVVKIVHDAIVLWMPEGTGNNVVIDANHAGEAKIIHLAVAVTGEWRYNVEPNIQDGFYLLGSLNNWTPSDEYRFGKDATCGENEFILNTTLAENDEIKVAKVVNGVTTVWYPGADNYTVDAAHAGEKAIYFQETYKEDWAVFGGYFWMGSNEPTAIANTAADAEAVKILNNGMLLIRKGDKTYNVMGQAVK